MVRIGGSGGDRRTIHGTRDGFQFSQDGVEGWKKWIKNEVKGKGLGSSLSSLRRLALTDRGGWVRTDRTVSRRF